MCWLWVGSAGGDLTDCSSTKRLIVFSSLTAVFRVCGFCVRRDHKKKNTYLKGCIWGKSKLSLHVLHALDYTPRCLPTHCVLATVLLGQKLTWECSGCLHVQAGGLATQHLAQKHRIGQLGAQPKYWVTFSDGGTWQGITEVRGALQIFAS